MKPILKYIKDFYSKKVLLFSMKYLFVVLLFINSELNSQTLSNYTFSASSGTYIPLSGAISLNGSGFDDGVFSDLNIGFDFYYMGSKINYIGGSSNGWIKLGSGTVSSAQYTNNLASGSNRPIVAPLWDDLQIRTAPGDILYKTEGSEPNRIFTIEYKQIEWNYNANADVISFQVKLYETSGKIELIYLQGVGSVNTGSGGASIGITAVGTGSGNYLSINGTGESPSVSSSFETTNLTSKPATGQIYSFTPLCPTSAPSILTFTAVTSNAMTLNWTNNGSNNVRIIIYGSMDGVNYSNFTNVASSATSATVNGLIPSTLYYWKLQYVSEGCMGSILTGSQSTAAFNASDYKTWNGGTTAWGTATNWTPNGVPSSTSDIYIPNLANDPSTGNATRYCRNIIIDPGTVVTVNMGSSYYFDCYGSVVNNGTINHTGAGYFFLNGTGKVIKGTGTYTLFYPYFYSGSSTILDGNITCYGIQQVGDIYFQNSIFELTGGGGFNTEATHWQQGTLFINAPIDNFTFDLQDDYYNVWIANSAGTTKLGTNITSLDIANDLWIKNSCTVNNTNVVDNTVNVGGNFINDGNYLSTSATINMNGNSEQNISGSSATTFYNLSINNSSSTGVLLQKSVNIVNTLTLNNGNIFSSSTNILTMNAGSVVTPSGGSTNSFVDGPIRKTGTTSFVFPTGKDTKWRRIGMGTPTISSTFEAEYNNSSYGISSLDPGSGFNNVSTTEWWNLNRIAGGNASVVLYWEDANASGINNCSDLRIAHWCASCNSGIGWWENNHDVNTATTGLCSSTNAGTIYTTNDVTSFSPFTFGSKSVSLNPLPVELINFKDSCIGSNVYLSWSTASEINNDFFIIEKSIDATTWEQVTQIDGASNSNTLRNYEFIDNSSSQQIYYRLVQIDFNGTKTYSKIISSNCVERNHSSLNVYPNPAQSSITIQLNNVASDDGILLVTDELGRNVLTPVSVYVSNSDVSKNTINVSNLPNGNYFIKSKLNKNVIPVQNSVCIDRLYIDANYQKTESSKNKNKNPEASFDHRLKSYSKTFSDSVNHLGKLRNTLQKNKFKIQKIAYKY